MKATRQPSAKFCSESRVRAFLRNGQSAQAGHCHDGPETEDRRESWRNTIYPGLPRATSPQSLLYREIVFKGEVLKGEQPPILVRALFDAVQARLNEQVTNHKSKWMKSEALLTGRIFDDRGNRMTPSHACRGNVKYRYYPSSTLLQGTSERAGSVRHTSPEYA